MKKILIRLLVVFLVTLVIFIGLQLAENVLYPQQAFTGYQKYIVQLPVSLHQDVYNTINISNVPVTPTN